MKNASWVRVSWLLMLVVLVAPASARAFCGFYVSGADGELFNRATMVVMMRDGTRTVLSMQNNYEGPPEDFAMVIPVPVVLSEETVKTLPHEIFTRVDRLAAPRLVEYWETDPCYVPPPPEEWDDMAVESASAGPVPSPVADGLGVTIEAEFVVGEYQIVILSAEDSGGLDTWLRREGYHIPDGAEPVLRPYVEAGTKFFVARVDLDRVTRVDGRVVLSPLRFHYDTETFELPVRLGLLNAGDAQDLIVHILARGQRYEVANYGNVTIPTNLLVSHGVRNEFGPFYVSLFDRLLERNPNHVVTEYSWDASGCDPCPTPALTPEELTTLGADVVEGDPYGFVLTRLHYRYGGDQLGQDLVFRAAPPIVGGRGIPDQTGHLPEQGAQPSGQNSFQGRYVMLNWWDGPIACDEPIRGRWGGPPTDVEASRRAPAAATNLAFVERGRNLDGFLAQALPSLGVSAGGAAHEATPPPTPARSAGSGGCASCAVGTGELGRSGAIALLLLCVALGRRRLR